MQHLSFFCKLEKISVGTKWEFTKLTQINVTKRNLCISLSIEIWSYIVLHMNYDAHFVDFLCRLHTFTYICQISPKIESLEKKIFYYILFWSNGV